MKQVLQSLKTGEIELAEVPRPAVEKGRLLIQTSCSLISPGTERMLVEFGRSGLLEKVRRQPDKVRQVVAKIKTDGLIPTLEAVRNKLDQPLPLGYCNVGRVIALGENVTGFSVGDRVVSNGPHAEVVSVPPNLCAKIPDNVTDEQAAFTVLGAIALQGIRLAAPTLGECVAVIGLGIIGLLDVQLLRANGCRVLGLDVDRSRLELARRFGAEVIDLASPADPITVADSFSRGRGVDAVIITASTDSSVPVHQAAEMCRKRGRIVLVGVTGLELSRDAFYKKEITFQVSCSYGPGRYDRDYEQKGRDYPFGFVRWTAQRNFEAFLDVLAMGSVDVKPLLSHRFSISDAQAAYKLLISWQPSLGILFEYQTNSQQDSNTVSLAPAINIKPGLAVVSFIGAGNYATSTLIPAFKSAGARLRCIAANGGVGAWHAAKKFGFEQATTDTEQVLSDPQTTAVVIATRHDSHADLALRALRSGKHVFVEKPLCMKQEELQAIESASRERPELLLMVGFNRRFSPLIKRMKDLLAGLPGPKAIVVTVNAGIVPKDHWVNDPDIGGGRILGEGCHFIDLIRFLIGSPFSKWQRFELQRADADTASLQFGLADGSIGTVHYLANGSKAFPTERVEVFAGGRVLQLDNFRVLRGFGWPGFRYMRLWRQDKGHKACAKAFIEAIENGGPGPIPLEELIEVHRISIALK